MAKTEIEPTPAGRAAAWKMLTRAVARELFLHYGSERDAAAAMGVSLAQFKKWNEREIYKGLLEKGSVRT